MEAVPVRATSRSEIACLKKKKKSTFSFSKPFCAPSSPLPAGLARYFECVLIMSISRRHIDLCFCSLIRIGVCPKTRLTPISGKITSRVALESDRRLIFKVFPPLYCSLGTQIDSSSRRAQFRLILETQKRGAQWQWRRLVQKPDVFTQSSSALSQSHPITITITKSGTQPKHHSSYIALCERLRLSEGQFFQQK